MNAPITHRRTGLKPANGGYLTSQGRQAMQTSLILFSGLPGCGKTSLARRVAYELGIPLFAKDRFQQVLRSQGLASRASVDGYRLVLDQADEQLSLGMSAILDGVFPLAGFRNEAQGIAARRDARFWTIYCYCSDEAVWQERVAMRVQYVPNWTPVSWDEVERLRETFQPWKRQEALFVDAIEPLEQNLAFVLEHLRGTESE